MFSALFRNHPGNLVGLCKIDFKEVIFRFRLIDSPSQSAYDMICLDEVAIFSKVLKVDNVAFNSGILNIRC